MTAAAVAMALLMTLTAVCKGVDDVDTRSTFASTLAQPKRVLVWMANPYAHGNVTIDSMIAGLKPNR
jgi:ABC-type glycerol-3-phosphate transport system substrate-binding protein